ncbi:hypothetical protein BGX27_005106 [Mortierella sp. AM989]|nr:hypothetical protein BGX27_005106 [Mortierella sp. AM989]
MSDQPQEARDELESSTNFITEALIETEDVTKAKAKTRTESEVGAEAKAEKEARLQKALEDANAEESAAPNMNDWRHVFDELKVYIEMSDPNNEPESIKKKAQELVGLYRKHYRLEGTRERQQNYKKDNKKRIKIDH